MANANQLSAGSGSGTQTTTGDPQQAVQPSTGGAQSSSVQPGTSSTLLSTSTGGVPLTSTPVTTVGLSSSTTASVVAPAVVVKAHHIDTPLLVFPAILIVVAAGLFWMVRSSAKNTTNY
ncbi:MAG: hypothetical protein ACREGB_03430 [Candidatus Saccharimonadales bacterium]